MSWPRRHELMDVDLDAYADDAEAAHTQPRSQAPEVEQAPEAKPSVLEAADLARVPSLELLRKLNARD